MDPESLSFYGLPGVVHCLTSLHLMVTNLLTTLAGFIRVQLNRPQRSEYLHLLFPAGTDSPYIWAGELLCDLSFPMGSKYVINLRSGYLFFVVKVG